MISRKYFSKRDRDARSRRARCKGFRISGVDLWRDARNAPLFAAILARCVRAFQIQSIPDR